MRKNQFGSQGSIYYVKSRNVYRVVAPVNVHALNEDGKPIRKSLGSYKTLEEAQKVLSLYIKTPTTYTLNEIMDLWLEDRFSSTTKPNTKKMYQYIYDTIIKRLLTPLLDTDIKKIHNKDISSIFTNNQYFKNHNDITKRCHYSYHSLCLIKTYLNDIFNYALGNGWIENNYISLIKVPKVEEEEKSPSKAYSEEEIEKLFDALSNPNTPPKMIRYIKIMLVLLYSGLRKEELFTCYFDTYRNIFSIRESKTFNGLREVPVHHRINDFIKKDINPDTHKPRILDGITSRQLNYNFDCINNYFGFGKHVVHDTRKTFVTRLITKGASLPLVARLVGHSTRSVTVDYYTKPDIEELRKVLYLLN